MLLRRAGVRRMDRGRERVAYGTTPGLLLQSPYSSAVCVESEGSSVMHICVLQPSYRDSDSCIANLDIRRDLSPLLHGHHVTHAFLDKATAVGQIQRLKADVFVNLCDGAWDEDTPGLDVVMALERDNRAFTGAGSAFYDPTREMMKEVCH